jgi:hypothetical protein
MREIRGLPRQQGDVLIKTDEDLVLPADAKPVEPKGGRLILAEGEATGHAHAIEACDEAQLFCTPAGELFLQVTGEKPVTVKHEEHKAVEVPPGTYFIDIVQEYDYFEDEARKVED